MAGADSCYSPAAGGFSEGRCCRAACQNVNEMPYRRKQKIISFNFLFSRFLRPIITIMQRDDHAIDNSSFSFEKPPGIRHSQPHTGYTSIYGHTYTCYVVACPPSPSWLEITRAENARMTNTMSSHEEKEK